MASRHVIVIGAGIGGLTAALELARGGFDVTVLEAQPTVGGKMRQIKFPGFDGIDSGPTVFTMRWVFDELFDDLGLSLNDHVRLESLDLLARHGWPDGTRLDLFADINRSADAIGMFAGTDAASKYREFCRVSAQVFQTLDTTYMRASRPTPLSLVTRIAREDFRGLTSIHPFRTLWSELGRLFTDPRLRQLFARYATYTGGSPFLAPATLMLIAHAERCGVWLVEGGMHALAQAFAQLIKQAGGLVRCNASVATILTDQNGRQATGVELTSGELLDADAIVFNGDVSALGVGLLGPEIARAHLKTVVKPEIRSQSAITWSAIAPATVADLAPHTVAFSPNYRDEFDDVFVRQRPPGQPTVYIHAPDRPGNGGTAEADNERIFLLMNAPAEKSLTTLTAKPGDLAMTATMPAREIEQHTTAMQRSLVAAGWPIRLQPDQCQITTPYDFARLFPASGGALYGRAPHGWQASFARMGSRSHIRGLYLAGGTVHPGPGVPMATMSGRLAAASIIEDF